MDQATITNSLKSYIQNLKRVISVDRVILYGSHATSDQTAESDVDLLVLSKDFSKLDPDSRLKILYRASVGLPYDLHAYGVTPEEFDHASPLTTLGAVKNSQYFIVN